MHILHNMRYFPFQGDWGKGGGVERLSYIVNIDVVLIDTSMRM